MDTAKDSHPPGNPSPLSNHCQVHAAAPSPTFENSLTMKIDQFSEMRC